MVGRDPEPGVTVYQQGESCCIALHVSGVDPVIRANLGTVCYPFADVRYGRLGGGAPLCGLVSGRLNGPCLIDSVSVPRRGARRELLLPRAGWLVTPIR